MKKTFTLLAIAILLTSASFAQNNRHDDDYGNDNDNEIAVNRHRGSNHHGWERGRYYFSAREKDMQLFSINKEYNRRIQFVRHRFFMSRAKKEHLNCSLELQRDSEVRSVLEKFNDRRNLFDARDQWYGDHDRNNNWYK